LSDSTCAPSEAVSSISSDSSENEEAGSETDATDVQRSHGDICSQFVHRNMPTSFSMIPFVSTAEVKLAWAQYNTATCVGKVRGVAKGSKGGMAKPPGQFHVPFQRGDQLSVAAPIPFMPIAEVEKAWRVAPASRP